VFTDRGKVNSIRFRGFRLTQLYFNSSLLFHSNYRLHVSVVRPSKGEIYTSEINTTRMLISDIYISAWRAALDGNPWTWSNTRNRMQTPKFKIISFSCRLRSAPQNHFLCFWYSFLFRLSKLQALMRLEGLGKLRKFIDFIGSRTRGLSVCSIVPQTNYATAWMSYM
jgi:hypothetical protein